MKRPDLRSLKAVRADFDAVDAALVALIVQRQRLAIEAGRIKAADHIAVVDVEREAFSANVRHDLYARHGLSDDDATAIENVFAVLLQASRDAQRRVSPQR